jgi:hypothetical protein
MVRDKTATVAVVDAGVMGNKPGMPSNRLLAGAPKPRQ